MRVNDTLILDLTAFSHDGRSIGRIAIDEQSEPQPEAQGMVVFVQGGLPGQRALVKLTRVKSRMAEATLLDVLSAAPDERPMPCPHGSECGGCPWQAMPYAEQCRWKEQLVRDALKRIGNITLPDEICQPIIPSPQEWGYRNKMEFAFAPGPNQQPILGLRRRGSRGIVEVEHCQLQSPLTMRVLALVREQMKFTDLPAWESTDGGRPGQQTGGAGIWRFLVVRTPASGGCVAEIITAPAPRHYQAIQAMGERLLTLEPQLTGFVHSVRRAPTDVAYGEESICKLGACALHEDVCVNGHTVHLQLEHNAFFQVNTAAAEQLYQAVYQAAKLDGSEYVCDVYCGVGGLALSLAPFAKQVLGLEQSAKAVQLAKENAADHSHLSFEMADAAYIGKYFRRQLPDVVVADPPRAGLAPEMIASLIKYKPRKLVLVSCNPATLARDLAQLLPYQITSFQTLDLFPQTPHCECVVSLELK